MSKPYVSRRDNRRPVRMLLFHRNATTDRRISNEDNLMSGRRNRFLQVLACLISGWLAFHCSLVAASDRRALRSAVVRITTPGHGSCTAVCDSPQGHLLSVAHCRSGDRSLATINGRRHPLRVLHAPPTTVKPPRTLYVFSAAACVSCRYVRRLEQRLRTA